MPRNVVVLSSDSDDDDNAPIVAAASGNKKGKNKPSRPVVISSDDEDGDEIDCVAIAAAEAEGSAQLAASLGALSVSSGTKEEEKEGEAPLPPPPITPLPPVAFGEILLDGAIASQLYPHQREGVAWMSSLASGVIPPPSSSASSSSSSSASPPPPPPPRRFHGGILADEMGLGKTRQVAAFLRGAVDSGVVRRALVVAPKSLLRVWAEELRVVGVAAREFGSGSPAERSAALAAVGPPRGSGVLLTTYGMLLHNGDELRGGGSGGKGKKKQQQEEAAAATAAAGDSSNACWDAVVFDEGHCLKNPSTKISELARSLDSRVKILLSGTPVQNNLDELFSLVDLVAPGLLAADARRFKSEFSSRIVAGSSRSASEAERAAAAGAARALRERMAPCFLRREKAAVLGVSSSSSSSASSAAAAGAVAPASSSPSSSSATPAALGRKTDLIVWLRLTPTQRDIYRAFLKSDAVAAALNKTRSPLAAVTVLKKICDHPGLLTARAAAAAAGRKVVDGDGESEEGEEEEEEEFDSDDDFIDDGDDDDGEYKPKPKRTPSPSVKGKGKKGSSSSSSNIEGGDEAAETPPPAPPLDPAALALEEQLLQLIAERGASASCKTQFAPKLVSRLVAEGHRVLVFSQSRVMLDIVGAALERMTAAAAEEEEKKSGDDKGSSSPADATDAKPPPFLRIDGTVASAAARQAIVARFQQAEPGVSPPVLLLTTGVGALGLTLTAATRVVLVEPGWNPSADSQAVDRAYRIGQGRDVVVYRLVCAATVEEKVLRKQIFKQSLAKAGTKSGIPFRYFSQQELGDLFSLDERALDAPPATAAAMLAALMQAGAPRDDEADAVVAREAAALAEVDRDAGQSSSSASSSSSSPVSAPAPLFAGVSDHGRLYSVAGAGRVGEHRPPSPERERRTNGGSSSTASWPPGATPRPPTGRGRRGSCRSPRRSR